ncbi:mitochondrial amidoxime-reducing component 1-like [Alosa alosa]|uniref:mitochondrial amidoxime-reducing component 1-like n=1 Tax=Alosa alosa TaxID=278164 RepID=UPI0020152FA8|nr:mitochondrial amidoxime-reducing component 1-like [Alosa alosa]XP_048095901.1 mitochondrial amidoxime-reducing component 1-like [Alosa alosa]
MLLSEASLRDLNSRLDKDVTVAQYRPSIVVNDCEACSEDSWNNIQIGTVRIKRVMACGSYRLCDPSDKKVYGTAPLFGQYYIVKQTGTLHVGEPVYKISY